MTIALRPGGSAVTVPALNDITRSQEGQQLAAVWGKLADERGAQAGVEQALGDLDTVADEAIEPDWDGYGAAPVSGVAYWKARRLLQVLPSSVPAPEIGITPRGEVALEWHAGPQWAFSIVVGTGGDATYAGIYGAGRLHGKEPFIDEIPLPLVDALFRYIEATGRR